jgi:hypothetical protein
MVFDSIGAQDYECLNAVNTDDYAVFRSLDGTPRKATWRPIVVRCVRGDRRWKNRFADFPSMPGGLLFLREKAAEVLKDMLEKFGELLPLVTEKGEVLYIHNTTFVLPNALDEEKAEFYRVDGIDRILGVRKPVFREDIVRGADLFRLPAELSSRTYVSDKFVDLVNKHNLKGLEFNPIECS